LDRESSKKKLDKAKLKDNNKDNKDIKDKNRGKSSVEQMNINLEDMNMDMDIGTLNTNVDVNGDLHANNQVSQMDRDTRFASQEFNEIKLKNRDKNAHSKSKLSFLSPKVNSDDNTDLMKHTGQLNDFIEIEDIDPKSYDTTNKITYTKNKNKTNNN